jgi:hypothetical protein
VQSRPKISFVARVFDGKWRDHETVGTPDDCPDRVRSGVDVWIVSTFLELRAIQQHLPFAVEATSRFPQGGISVAHWDDLRVGRRFWQSRVVGIRADRPPLCTVPWQVVQTPIHAKGGGGGRSVHIPSWPQPGLVRRTSSRHGIRRLGYFGRLSSLPGFLSDPAFQTELARRGVEFHADEKAWRDYSATDVCIGLRFEPAIAIASKPYAKLVNAWHAEVPALLGPEPAYRAIRQSEFDYLEVATGRDVLDAIDRLISEPTYYDSMVRNGIERRVEFSRQAVRDRWINFIESVIHDVTDASSSSLSFPLAALLRQWVETRQYKITEALESRRLKMTRAGNSW